MRYHQRIKYLHLNNPTREPHTMRTTLTIDDDVLQAAKERARREGKTAGDVISELARRALTMPMPSPAGLHGAKAAKGVCGFVPFPKREGVIITHEIINALRDEGEY
jgi:hypothetical protein